MMPGEAAIPGVDLALQQLLKVPPLQRFLTGQLVSNLRGGQYRAASKGRGMEFAEVRGYLPGDDVRNIDWRITARTGKPHTKLFREERDRCVYILLDLDPAMYFGSQGQLKARLATLLAAAAAWQALQQGDRMGGLVLLGDDLFYHPPAGRRRDLLRWLQLLLEHYQAGLHRPPATQTMRNALQRLSELVRPGSQIHIISDFYRMSDSAWLWLHRLHKSQQVFCYQVTDALEEQVQGSGTLEVDNGRQQGWLGLHDPAFVQHYRQIARHRQAGIQRHLHDTCQRAFRLDAARRLGNADSKAGGDNT